MRYILLLLFGAFGFAFHQSNQIEAFKKPVAARCTGSSPCYACSNCSSCKWCSGGGTCGVCARGSSKTTQRSYSSPRKYSTPGISGGQCKAMTKKGTRCSRKSRSNGYCWQHGG